MARFSRLDVLNTTIKLGLVPIFYHGQLEIAKQIVAACAQGGARVVEFTNRGDSAWHVFSQLAPYCAEHHPEVILGIGSVVDAPTAAMYIAAGANFVVGPNLNREVALLCNRRKIAYMPGCGSLTEISEAEASGVELVKIFPGNAVGGPDFVKAVLGPSPWTRMVVTGGVEANKENITSWFKAGVTAVGMGSNLIQKDAVAAGNFETIALQSAQILDWIETAQSG